MHKLRILLLLLLIGMRVNAQMDSIENLVFEGAGIRGLVYGGAIAGLEAHGVLKNIRRVGGTSSGAITALLLCLGYNAA
jgi:NTE family protein